MEVSTPQRQSIQAWLAAGATLSDVQKRLKSEFDITMTYMEVRMLVLEIGATVQDPPEPEQPQPAAKEEDPYADEFDDTGEGAAPDGVSVTLDRVMRPGAMVSGEVTFPDGQKGKWLIDQYGRFGLDPDTPGHQPSPSDMQAFQDRLRIELRRHGYG